MWDLEHLVRREQANARLTIARVAYGGPLPPDVEARRLLAQRGRGLASRGGGCGGETPWASAAGGLARSNAARSGPLDHQRGAAFALTQGTVPGSAGHAVHHAARTPFHFGASGNFTWRCRRAAVPLVSARRTTTGRGGDGAPLANDLAKPVHQRVLTLRRDEAGWLFVPLRIGKRCRLTLEADAVLVCGRRLDDDAPRNRGRCLRLVSGSGRLSAPGVPLGIPWLAPLPSAGTDMQWD
eukprot:gene7505-698_t